MGGAKTTPSDFNYSLAISEKSLRKGLPQGAKPTHGGGISKDKRSQKNKVKAGMPW